MPTPAFRRSGEPRITRGSGHDVGGRLDSIKVLPIPTTTDRPVAVRAPRWSGALTGRLGRLIPVAGRPAALNAIKTFHSGHLRVGRRRHRPLRLGRFTTTTRSPSRARTRAGSWGDSGLRQQQPGLPAYPARRGAGRRARVRGRHLPARLVQPAHPALRRERPHRRTCSELPCGSEDAAMAQEVTTGPSATEPFGRW